MRCYGCNEELSDKELMMNSEDDFILNKCLCKDCISVSNIEMNSILKDLE